MVDVQTWLKFWIYSDWYFGISQQIYLWNTWFHDLLATVTMACNLLQQNVDAPEFCINFISYKLWSGTSYSNYVNMELFLLLIGLNRLLLYIFFIFFLSFSFVSCLISLSKDFFCTLLLAFVLLLLLIFFFFAFSFVDFNICLCSLPVSHFQNWSLLFLFLLCLAEISQKTLLFTT